jgi:hypothetical protein
VVPAESQRPTVGAFAAFAAAHRASHLSCRASKNALRRSLAAETGGVNASGVGAAQKSRSLRSRLSNLINFVRSHSAGEMNPPSMA